MSESLDTQLKTIATSFSRQFQEEYGYVSSSNELQAFMSTYDMIIGNQVAKVTQHLLLVATSEGIDNIGLLIQEIRNAKARTVSYLWRQIAALRAEAGS